MMRTGFKLLYALSWVLLVYLWWDARDQVTQLEGEVAQLQATIAEKNPKRTVTRVRKASDFRSRMFAMLYEINRNGKKVRARPGELLVEDWSLVRDDHFLDLIDLLHDADALVMIEVPAKNKTIREELKLAGYGPEFVKDSTDARFRIKNSLTTQAF